MACTTSAGFNYMSRNQSSTSYYCVELSHSYSVSLMAITAIDAANCTWGSSSDCSRGRANYTPLPLRASTIRNCRPASPETMPTLRNSVPREPSTSEPRIRAIEGESMTRIPSTSTARWGCKFSRVRPN